MVNIYANTIVKEICEWIVLIMLTIGLLWILVFNCCMPKVAKNLEMMPTPQTAIAGYILEFGGIVLVPISIILLYIFQIYWNPHKHLRNVDNDKLNNLINENK